MYICLVRLHHELLLLPVALYLGKLLLEHGLLSGLSAHLLNHELMLLRVQVDQTLQSEVLVVYVELVADNVLLNLIPVNLSQRRVPQRHHHGNGVLELVDQCL